ncbi:class I SAM-dependent methyltransferase [Candidatus Saccharibacteria bacterium]|nr:class I SAM-dependent methyltransferase [Candidatus Saccharibacteria bacterium]MBQ9017129.1 class I SAM-dependent methyltransferase [Candidatus Saccharibacteria bacterium]
MSKENPIVIDYNGYDYEKFWKNSGREYEDAADKLAISKLLPKEIDSIVDIAGGYGRLAPMYLDRAKKSTLFDYSKTELKQAKEIYGDRLNTKAGDAYHMPFKDGEFSAAIMVRATHHFEDVEKVVAEIYRILEPGGVAVIEVANKKTLPRMVRYWRGKSDVNPFDLSIENRKDVTKTVFYNYHPKYIENIFKKAGFKIEKVRSVSNFRSKKLKKVFGKKGLMALERGAQKALAPVRFAPSIYYRLKK